MNYQPAWQEVFHLSGVVQELQALARHPVELEPARVAELVGSRPELPLAQLPDRLDHRVPLADGVQEVIEHVAELGSVHQLANGFGQFLVARISTGRFDADGQTRHGTLAGAQHGRIVRVLFLHLLGEGQVVVGIAGGGCLEDGAQASRVQGGGHCGGRPGLIDACSAGLDDFLQKISLGDRTTLGVQDGGLGHYRTPPTPQWSWNASSSSNELLLAGRTAS
ncbi:hypothetical protein D9M69_502750 [compost metagenome]